MFLPFCPLLDRLRELCELTRLLDKICYSPGYQKKKEENTSHSFSN